MRLLEGPEVGAGAESYANHVRRLGGVPDLGPGLIGTLQRSGLAGRGGAAFPTAVKWQAVAERSRGQAVVVVNGAEGEPRSQKDRLLMSARPHLVLDGAFIAARVLRARRVIVYIGERHQSARAAMLRAVAERPDPERGLVTFSAAPARYVAGAEAAAIHFLNEGVATPTPVPPYPSERGVAGPRTPVQNVEPLPGLRDGRDHALPGERELRAMWPMLLRASRAGGRVHADLGRQLGRPRPTTSPALGRGSRRPGILPPP